MIVAELIRKKRDGGELSQSEIQNLVKGFSDSSIPDYQISAWLMSVFLKGMSDAEVVHLTKAMRDSGEIFDWADLLGADGAARVADKHSTGGVGDKVSVMLAPLASCLGLKVPMMSGRGLSFTGGTVDKLEGIPGFEMRLPRSKMVSNLKSLGVCMMSQSERMCPADRKLYALRDVTGTVESLPLITASILSKKAAAGIKNLVLDVKCGTAAFMTSLDEARALAQSLVRVARLLDIQCKAIITRMSEPLGSQIGNRNEILECEWILKNDFPTREHQELAAPLKELTLRLTAEMALMAGERRDLASTVHELEMLINSGQAFECYQAMLKAQGVQLKSYRQKMLLETKSFEFKATRAGYLNEIASREIGLAGCLVGIGRSTAEDKIQPGVSFEVLVRCGQKIELGQTLLRARLKKANDFAQLEGYFDRAFKIDRLLSYKQSSLILEEVT
jgi:pyrimidine-nucleoside phosphorylase